MLTYTDVKKCQLYALSHFSKWMPLPSDAAFPLMCHCLTPIYEIAYSLKSENLSTIIAFSNYLKTSPGSPLLMSIYLKLQEAITSHESSKEMYALNLITTWIENDIITCDCYGISKIIFEWCVYLCRNVYMSEFLPIVSIHFLESSNRFFPYFVGVAKFVVKLAEQKRGKDEEEQLRSVVMCAADKFEIKCKAHSTAITILAKGGDMKTALQLARFDCDCEKSNEIVEETKKLMSEK
ncbi:hypothetical protein GPJ56_000621 [Histomonas meleagridis]|uniref:uncharacterized protein n=1 Tax=Histomonas meleagridis TaxID=135588 RepID=UPI00355A4FF3|nr:hypothetical protein GPJ56_000621 [Histomonas meleagridis]KAH0804748.1 hypothetical protein GO595_002442 [Histomonas meleagridis]